jgi:hypothetical protein
MSADQQRTNDPMTATVYPTIDQRHVYVRLSDDYVNEGPFSIMLATPASTAGLLGTAAVMGICIGSLCAVPDRVTFAMLVTSQVLLFGNEIQRPILLSRRYATNALGCLLALDAAVWLAG